MTSDYDRALSALNHLGAGCCREEWVRIYMAAKAAGLSFESVHEWSKNAGSYKGEKDCRNTWDSIDELGGITDATLFYMAREKGWRDTIESPVESRDRNYHQEKSLEQRLCVKSTNQKALHIWEKCLPAPSEHEYILRKNGRPDGLRYYPPTEEALIINGKNVAGWLVVPCWQNEEIQTLQFISSDGEKLNLSGASFNEGYFSIGELTDRIFVCEGIGQAWAVNKVTGVTAVVCFGAGRMMMIANRLRAKYHGSRLTIVSDREKETQASEIAKAVDGQWIKLPQDKPKNYDVNDYAREFGYDELANLLANIQVPNLHYKLLSAGDLINAPPMRWLVRGVIPMKGFAALYGPSGSGKSFLILDMACTVAAGDKYWFGRSVTQTAVTYICLEGEEGLGKRVKAWEVYSKRALPDALRFITQPFDLLSGDVFELAKAVIAGGGLGGLVIIDTLNRAAPGADENSSVDMGNIIAAAKQLQNQIGGVVLLVHHTGKQTASGLRGHSSLYASLDGVIEVTKADNPREWIIAKSKEDVTGEKHSFKLEIVPLGADDEGGIITSCVAVPDENIDSVKQRIIPPKSGNQRIIWDALKVILFEAAHFGQGGAPIGRSCIRLEEAIEKTRCRLICEKKRQTERAQSAITGLINRGLLMHQDGWIWLV